MSRLSSSSCSSLSSLAESCAPLSPDTAYSSATSSPTIGTFGQVEACPQDDGKEYVMVIGGLGYIGSHTSLELLKEGYNVIVVDNLSNCFESVLDRIRLLAANHCRHNGVSLPTLRLHKLDYNSPAMSRLFATYNARRSIISGVIHFAAFKSVSESIDNPLAYYKNNVAGLVDLLLTIQQNGIKNFVFSSSATVYGAKANEGKPLQEQDLIHFDEVTTDAEGNQTVRPNGTLGLTSPYGRTKYFSEAILADTARADPTMRITALRYFNPVGCHPSGLLREDPRQKPTNLFPVIASVIEGSRSILEIFGSDWNTRDGTAVRDFIHVMDLARGHVAALAATKSESSRTSSFETYNLGTGNGMSVAEVVESFEKASNIKVPAVRAPRRKGDVGFCIAATESALKNLGFTTARGVDECCRDTWKALNMPIADHC
jgi:UDP-glucose 4-epimerase